MKKLTPEQIDEILPQTQCGLCNYGGCMPYAEAIVYENAAINLCPPGGTTTLKKLAAITQQNPEPYLADMEQKTKSKMLAVIRENECIGCTKCIQACPVDAILGAAKQMHTVIAAECSGCELCVAPCPVDCIDMVSLPDEMVTAEDSAQYRQRYYARQSRLSSEKQTQNIKQSNTASNQRKNYIEAAIARIKAKKSS